MSSTNNNNNKSEKEETPSNVATTAAAEATTPDTEDEESPPKRRRIQENDEQEEDDSESLLLANRRAARMKRLAAVRRRKRLQEEVQELQLQTEEFTPLNNDIHSNNPDDGDDFVVADHDDEDYDENEDDPNHVANNNAAPLPEEEEDDGEDLMDHAERDYQRIAALDTYGTEGIDDRTFGNMDVDARRRAEEELAKRDGRRSEGVYASALESYAHAEDEEARQARRALFRSHKDNDGDDPSDGPSDPEDGDDSDEDDFDEADLDGDDPINLEAFDVPLREWIAQGRTRKEIQRKFRAFLRHFRLENDNSRGSGGGWYEQKMKRMCANNHQSLVISFAHLMQSEPVLTLWLSEAPKDMLEVLNEAITKHTLMLFPAYKAIQQQIHVRIAEVPIWDSLRDLRRSHLDQLVKVHAVVTRRSTVYPQLCVAHYRCLSCKATQGPFRIDESHASTTGSASADAYLPEECPLCEGTKFMLDKALSQYRNFQRVNLQEAPGSVPPGRVPRTKECILTNDLIDSCRPGEEVEVTAVFEHKYDPAMTFQSGFPVFSTFLSANHVSKRDDESAAQNLSEQDIRDILDLAKDPRIGQRIVQSMAPSIFGHDHCKMALAMSLFGGVPKNVQNKHRIRGDCNVLLLGDPGTAKSQLLKYAEHTAPRAVYSTGKGASAVGLTAGVHKDPITKEWTLEGGALVLADKGVCLIDEFDKMNEQDRTSIHEAMEQQSISVSKAGIVTSLQARCSVIAAANPIGGRYDSSNTLADNVELTDPILQRFDILCVLQDTVDPVSDERLARFVTSSHMNAVSTRDLARGDAELAPLSTSPNSVLHRPGMIDQELLRKYIQYARTNVRPSLSGNTFDQEKVASLYVALRKESTNAGGVPICVRHVESIMRMAEAHAKMHLREHVRDDDMDAAIQMMLESFITAQKFSVRRSLRKSFAKFITSGEDRASLLLHILQGMMRKEQMYQTIHLRRKNLSEDLLETLEVDMDEFAGKARARRIYDVQDFCKGESFQEAGYYLDAARGKITRSLVE